MLPTFSQYFNIVLFSAFNSQPLKFLCEGLGLAWLLTCVSLVKQIFWAKEKNRSWHDHLFLGAVALGFLPLLVFVIPFTHLTQTVLMSVLLSMLWQMIQTISIFLGLTSLPFFISTAIAKVLLRRNLARWLSELLLVAPLLVWMAILGLLLSSHDPIASNYFKLNAAIKNTCLLDPQRDHCPTKLEEISYIEPVEFKQRSEKTDFYYTYDPATNQYTFIARPRAKRVVVFDQRLIATEGVDFKEFDVFTEGQDHIINPPAFPGPWNLPEWQHSWGR